jgi:hypothetical protein
MILRYLMAVLSGMLVGIVLYEGLLAVLTLLWPGFDPIAELYSTAPLQTTDALLLSLFWALGASASSMMASGLARARSAGALCAGLWLLSIALLIGLTRQPASMLGVPVSIGLLAWLLSVRFIPVQRDAS